MPLLYSSRVKGEAHSPASPQRGFSPRQPVTASRQEQGLRPTTHLQERRSMYGVVLRYDPQHASKHSSPVPSPNLLHSAVRDLFSPLREKKARAAQDFLLTSLCLCKLPLLCKHPFTIIYFYFIYNRAFSFCFVFRHP